MGFRLPKSESQGEETCDGGTSHGIDLVPDVHCILPPAAHTLQMNGPRTCAQDTHSGTYAPGIYLRIVQNSAGRGQTFHSRTPRDCHVMVRAMHQANSTYARSRNCNRRRMSIRHARVMARADSPTQEDYEMDERHGRRHHGNVATMQRKERTLRRRKTTRTVYRK